ncbi:MAG: RNA pseudouridine synthase [Deltaproteobacteria bacterium]|nr:MAG: RNA pseudouridine synthase [Deltaproteobacteria bacterium]
MKHQIKVLKTGDGWIGIEKPCGISVHNDPGKDVLSIVTSMARRGDIDLQGACAKEKIRILPVHRLDKDVSGVLLLAFTPDTLRKLGVYFHQGLVQKKYLALVHGNFDESEPGLKAWNFPLSKNAGGRKNPAGNGKKVKATTRFTLLRQSPHYTLLEILLITGRKHQIRRHAKLDGHPVTGDRRYGSKKSIAFLKNNCGYNRLGLHAKRLEIPDMAPPVLLDSEKIPPEMEMLLNQDRP